MKKLFMVFRIAFRALSAHKLRSFLTMLGVVIGVAAVIALVAAGEGARRDILRQFESLGSNLLTIYPSSNFQFSGDGLQSLSRPLTNNDAGAIERLATAVRHVAPNNQNSATVVFGSKTINASVYGVNELYDEVNNLQIARGRFITADDQENSASVVVLSESVVEKLFGSKLVDPTGQTVRIKRQNYRVVGVLAGKEDVFMGGFGDQVYLPLRTAQVRLGGAGNQKIDQISLQANSAEEMDLAQAQVRTILRALRGLEGEAKDDFSIQNQADLLKSISDATGTFTVLLGSIAAISLLVGGIGIMNIMLVSVTERTREVGLRKAVGAKRGDILVQFLTEAMVLSLLGGAIGVALGIGGAHLIAPMLGGGSAYITTQSVVLALGVSLGIGVFFGLYPANRASLLKPIDALRYE
jgi:putative ABC transport system permease protein